MSAPNRQIKQQIFGFTELPEQSGAWGLLLPRPGEKQVAHEPEAADIVQEINPAFMSFRSVEMDVNRGWFFALGAWMFCLLASVLISLLVSEWHPSVTWLRASPVIVLMLLAVGGAAVLSLNSIRSALAPPFILSRRLRKLYAWSDKKTGWRVFDYDTLIPTTFIHRVVTGAGGGTVYMLRLCQLDPGTRRITGSIGPVPPRGGPEHCGAAWEFIRRYMDGPPAALPAVKWQPPIGDMASAWFQIDRDMFVDHIDSRHRLKPSLFSWVFVWFWSVIDYWQRIATIWIQRTAPRPAYPPELVDALRSDGPNPYKRIEPVGDEALALHGKSPRMRLRWNVVRVLATALWGGLLAAMIVSVLTGR